MKKLLITLFVLSIGTAINASALGSFGSFGSFFKKLQKEEPFQRIEWPRQERQTPKIEWPVFKFPEDIFKNSEKTESSIEILKRIIPGITQTQTHVVRTSVPDGGATLALLGFALIGLGAVQRYARRGRT